MNYIKNKVSEIEQYFNQQNDWSTKTEFEHVKWLIENIKTLDVILESSQGNTKAWADKYKEMEDICANETNKWIDVCAENLRLEEDNKQLKIEFEKLFDNWALSYSPNIRN